ncbi:MAG: NAD-dependent epimerase/dehydratase family protein [Thermoplasmata archaeon]|nr:NAD-dependent epimerase/dehydratase family protein [Thermoplasmata archaeon]
MKVLVTGIDGYTGWPLALHLLARGHDVVGIDNFVTRRRVKEVGADSATPIKPFPKRIEAVRELTGKTIGFHKGDLGDYEFVDRVLRSEKPDAIVHLAEQRSAPYSMIDVHHAVTTQVENLTGTLHILYAMREHTPEAHLIKMGTMGEYGTPNIEIPEGFFEIEYKGRKDLLPFPRQGGSWYHWSKVFDSGDVMFASKIWGLRATDVMQGVVYGTRTPEITDNRLLTRFDFDEVWGTALNRFVVQALLGLPITPYGAGEQRRGFLALEDSMQSLRIAVESPPPAGEYRVWNQFDEEYSVNQLAEITQTVAAEKGIAATIEHPPDPRHEAERHFYHPIHEALPALGYRRSRELPEVIREIFADLRRYRRRIEAKRHTIAPVVRWATGDNRSAVHGRAPTSTVTAPVATPAAASPTGVPSSE